ncbi:MAG TPA: hypothetical protein VKZ50_02720 [bacterium]|nr:hypothetical protein [bacterium]
MTDETRRDDGGDAKPLALSPVIVDPETGDPWTMCDCCGHVFPVPPEGDGDSGGHA